MLHKLSSPDEVRFPYLNEHIREDYPIITGAIDEWFERCMKDCPWKDDTEMVLDGEYWIYWFDRWFSQFREEK
jgi:hypothetical protein